MNEMTDLPDVAGLGYEQARDELVAIVRRLEGGQAPLDDTLALWERGEALAARCRAILADAQARLDRASASGGSVQGDAAGVAGGVNA